MWRAMALTWIGAFVDPPDRGVRDDDVLECLAGHDLRRGDVLADQIDDAAPGLVRDLAPLLVGSGDRRAAGQGHPERLGERVHRGRGAHRVAVAVGLRRRSHHLDELLVVDLAGRVELARLPEDGAGAVSPPPVPAVEHRAAGEHDGGEVHGSRGHELRRRCLVASGREHHPVEGVSVQHLDEPEIGEIAVEGRGGALPGLLDRMHRELERDPARGPDPGLHPLREPQVHPVAGGEVAPGLGDPDDRAPRLELLPGDPEVHVALDMDGGAVRVAQIMKPELASKSGAGCAHGYCLALLSLAIERAAG